MTNNVIQRIWGVFDPVLNILKGVTTSGEFPYYSVLAGIQVVANYAALRQVSHIGNTAVIALGANTPADGSGGTYVYVPSDSTSGAWFVGTISGAVLSVTQVFNGTITVGESVNRSDTDVTVGTILSLGTGSGGVGTYNLSAAASAPNATIMTADNPPNILVGFDGGRWYLSVPFSPVLATNLLPTSTLTYNVGSPSSQWLNVYAQNGIFSGILSAPTYIGGAGTFTGTLQAATLNLAGGFVGSALVPNLSNTYALGSSANSWSQLYLGANKSPLYNAASGNALYFGPTQAEITYFGSLAAALAAIINPWCSPYTIWRYYNNTGDHTSALQIACNCGAASGNAMVTVGMEGVGLTISGKWTVDLNTTGVDLTGVYVNATGFSALSLTGWCAPFQSSTDPNQRAAMNQAHPLKLGYVQGPGVTATNTCLLLIADTNPISGDYLIPGVYCEFGSVNWAQDLIWGNGAFDCVGYIITGETGGSATTYSVTQLNAINSGERNELRGYWLYNKAYGIQNLSPNATIHIVTGSMDGFTRALSNSAGLISAEFLHLEGPGDTDYWFSNTSTNGKIQIRTLEVVLDGPKTAFPIGYCDSSVTWGGIDIELLNFGTGPYSYGTMPLIAGTGNVRIGTVYGLGTAAAQPYYTSLAENVLADPIFASNGFTADGWTAAGSAAPVVEGTAPYSGTKDVKFATTGAQTSTLASRIIPCKPGQQVFCQIQAQMPTWNAGAFFTATISYVRADGAALTSVIGGTTGAGFEFMDLTSTAAGYAPFSCAISGGLGRAPAGTVGVELYLELQGATAVAYLGQVIINVK